MKTRAKPVQVTKNFSTSLSRLSILLDYTQKQIEGYTQGDQYTVSKRYPGLLENIKASKPILESVGYTGGNYPPVVSDVMYLAEIANVYNPKQDTPSTHLAAQMVRRNLGPFAFGSLSAVSTVLEPVENKLVISKGLTGDERMVAAVVAEADHLSARLNDLATYGPTAGRSNWEYPSTPRETQGAWEDVAFLKLRTANLHLVNAHETRDIQEKLEKTNLASRVGIVRDVLGRVESQR